MGWPAVKDEYKKLVQDTYSAEDVQASLAFMKSSVEAVDVERHQEGDRLYFTGKVVNKGKSPARGIQVEINLFAGAKFVDQYSTYISSAVPAGGERFFKVSCGCKDAQPAAHDSFRTLVLSTY
jgi:hypothetical protein